MGSLCPSMASRSSDGTHDPADRSIYSEPSRELRAMTGVSSYWDITTAVKEEAAGAEKASTLQAVRRDDIVACGAFGRGMVTEPARDADRIVVVALTGWTLATGEHPKMYLHNPQLTMRRVVSKTGNDMALDDVVVALAP